ncbi:MAG: PTS ascorbate-specific transporter subunit IIA [Spartobacteria bacterium]|nr:PTS ascorbate-specific transporter subunit IIA [Spartobacteria bacterium]
MSFREYIVNEKAVLCNVDAADWEDAIIKGGQLLLDRGACTPEYLTTIIKKCKENGPYIIIAPGMAMPHARPEEGALALGYGIVTLKTPVHFGDPDNDPIELLIYIAAPSVKEHNEEAVCQVADICDDEELVESIMRAESADVILKLLQEKEL